MNWDDTTIGYRFLFFEWLQTTNQTMFTLTAVSGSAKGFERCWGYKTHPGAPSAPPVIHVEVGQDKLLIGRINHHKSFIEIWWEVRFGILRKMFPQPHIGMAEMGAEKWWSLTLANSIQKWSESCTAGNQNNDEGFPTNFYWWVSCIWYGYSQEEWIM